MLVEVSAAYRGGVWIVEPPKSWRRSARHRDFVTHDDAEMLAGGLCDGEPIPDTEDSYSYADERKMTLVVGIRL